MKYFWRYVYLAATAVFGGLILRDGVTAYLATSDVATATGIVLGKFIVFAVPFGLLRWLGRDIIDRKRIDKIWSSRVAVVRKRRVLVFASCLAAYIVCAFGVLTAASLGRQLTPALQVRLLAVALIVFWVVLFPAGLIAAGRLRGSDVHESNQPGDIGERRGSFDPKLPASSQNKEGFQ